MSSSKTRQADATTCSSPVFDFRVKYGLIFFVVAFLFLALVGYQIAISFSAAKSFALADAKNSALLLESKIGNDFAIAESTVKDMVAEIDPDAMHLETTRRYRRLVTSRLASHSRDSPPVSALFYIDADGNRLYSSADNDTPANGVEQPYVRRLKGDTVGTIVYSEPTRDHATGRALMWAAKPIRSGDGAFLGAAVVSLNLTALHEHFRSTDLGAMGMATLRRIDDDAAVAHYPESRKFADFPLPGLQVRQAMLADAPSGAAEIATPIDGIQRTFAYLKMKNFPFYVTVGIVESDYLAVWHRSAARAIFASLLFLSILATVFFQLAMAESKRRKSERTLRESEARFRTLIDQNNAIILQIDPASGRILDANASACNFYGWPREQMRAKTIRDINALSPDQIAAELAAAKEGQRNHFVFPHRIASGETRIVEVNSTSVTIGGRTTLFSIVYDVTQRARDEKRIDRLMREQKAILDSRVVGIVKVKDRKFVWTNQAFAEMGGYTQEDLLGQPTLMIYPSGHAHATFGQQAYLAIQNGEIYRSDFQFQRKDGSLGWYEISGGMLDTETNESIWVFIDITRRKHVEQARDEALGRLQKIASRVPGVVYQFLMRPDGSFCLPFASDAIRDILGVSPEQVRQDASMAFSRLHPDDYGTVMASILTSAQDLVLWNHDFRVKHEDGTVRWLHGNAMPDRETDGSVLWHGYIADITERKHAEAIFQGVFDQSIFLAGILDEKQRLVEVNNTALRVAAVPREAVIGKYFPDTPWWGNAPDRERLLEVLHRAYTGSPASFEATHVGPNGEQVNVMFNAMPICLEEGTRVAVVGVDITERKRAENALRESENRFHRLADSAPVLIWISDVEKRHTWFNQVWLDFTGRSMEQGIGNGWTEGVHPDDMSRCMETYMDAFESRRPFTTEYRMRRFDGQFRWLTDHGIPRYDDQGTFLGYIGSCIDLTDRHQMEEQVRQLGFYDPLTRLPNRRLFNDRLHQSMTIGKRSGCCGTVMFLDLDNFKSLNDKHGHEVGDLLLIEVANRLKSCVREMDTVARFGGDEFVVMIGELDVRKAEARLQACAIGEKIRAALSAPYFLTVKREQEMEATVEHHCTASIGVVLFCNHEARQEDVLKCADVAMYRAKETGGNLVQFYDDNA